ncbi:uncharacterized protein LOC117318802 [Pecten maximus]|uniref:uncharacterized protein LOC117318802 n=1 Tax=Pecten maximus TaxID=6579 RepID=UPI0014590B51|nr:uncharacterized protein LOC117318802 [Pecten maximus]
MTHTQRDNLGMGERKALQALKRNTDIVIKPADKGSAVVVMNREDYIQEANRQLSNETFYRKVDQDLTGEHANKVNAAISRIQLKGDIDKDTAEFLRCDSPRAGSFYLLPKIHKAGNPGRPIINSIGHPTEKISKFIDFHLRSHVESLPSYLKDTTYYLKKTPCSNLPDDTLLVTMDVVSLYTNIPHEDGIIACRSAWDTRGNKHPSTDSLVELLKLVLTLNNFTFNGEHYLQVSGTAMGTKMAPSYANVFMGHLETRLLIEAPSKPLSWFRFIDDIEIKWTAGRESLEEFVRFANEFHRTIKFTADISDEKNTFLDTCSTLVNGEIHTDLYSKPTDTHRYLRPSSCHPPHTTRSIPYSQILRIRRIVSDDDDFRRRCVELRSHLLNRGYGAALIDREIDRVKELDRASTLEYKDRPKTGRVPCVVTFHPGMPALSKIFQKHWHIVLSSSKLEGIFPEPPILAYRRPKNIRYLVVSGNLPSPSNASATGCFETCSSKRCKLCPYTHSTNSFNCETNGQKYRILQSVSCTSANVIYLITCAKCSMQYVGETKTQLNLRINYHRCSIKQKRQDLPVARHFNMPSHTWHDMQVVPIDHCRGWNDQQRLNRERHWINQLQTDYPLGMNER